MPAKKVKKENESVNKKKEVKVKKPIRREVGGIICLGMSILTLLSLLNLDGLLLVWIRMLLKGLFGYGFYAMPIVFIAMAVVLLFHRGKPVALRIICLSLLLFLIGGLSHVVTTDFAGLSFEKIIGYWSNPSSGGVISGGVSDILATLISEIGVGIFFGIATAIVLVFIFNEQIFKLIHVIKERYRNRPQYEEREEVEIEKKPTTVQTEPKKKKISDYDIKMDGETQFSPVIVETTRVKAPHEVLLEQEDRAPIIKDESDDDLPTPVIETPKEEIKLPKIKEYNFEPAKAVKEEKTEKVEIASKNTDKKVQYKFPPIALLKRGGGSHGGSQEELKSNAQRLIDTIHSFNIDAKIVNITHGPTVARYELELNQGIKLAKLTSLADDIALALGATGVRIAPIPDKISMVGIEVPNKKVSTVLLRDIIETPEFKDKQSKLTFALGKDIGGSPIIGDIAKLPHVLIAGTTGSGKSVCVNSLLISLLYKASPEDVKLIMIDPKMIELVVYNHIPHLLVPVVTDPKRASGALQWAVNEMMQRYKKFSQHQVRDIFSYNEVVKKNNADENATPMEKMPQIVIVIDELADLMFVAGKEVEESICRLAQMARAAGMHLVIATQRPSADIITGIMKANIPSRIAFAVASGIESRIILDSLGAEKLVGRGDMLYNPIGALKPVRVQGCLVTSEEVEAVVEYVKKYGVQADNEEVQKFMDNAKEGNVKAISVSTVGEESESDDADPLLNDAINIIMECGQASTSMLQRRLKLGYARAARIIDQMEERKIVGPFEGSKPRQILMTKEEWEKLKES